MSSQEEEESDAIGDTVYSKQWVIGCLLKTVQFMQSESLSGSEECDDDSSKHSEIEDMLCTLWDMSSNEHVQQVLYANSAHLIFINSTLQTNSPRIAEICIGILANLVHHDEMCKSVCGDSSFCMNVISWLSSSDLPFLVQLIRFLNTIVCKEGQSVYMTIAQNRSQFVQDILHLLQNCLNVDLLKLLLQLMNQLLYLNNELGAQFLQEDHENVCISALCQACFQVTSSFDISDIDDSHEPCSVSSSSDFDFFYHFWFIIRMLFEPEHFTAKFETCLEELKELFHRFYYFGNSSANSYLSYSAACSFFLVVFNTFATSNLNTPLESTAKLVKEAISSDNLMRRTNHKTFQQLQNHPSDELTESALSTVQEFDSIFSTS